MGSEILTIMYSRIRLDITNKCNLRCTYCHAQSSGTPFTKEELIKLIHESSKMNCTQFSILGGEPFMSQDLFLLVKECKGDVFISTNGHFFTKDNIQKIRENPNIKIFRISLDGTKSHNKLRIGSDYNIVVEGIRKVNKELPYIKIEIRSAVNKESYKELPELYCILKTLKIDRWKIIPLWIKGRTNIKSKFLISDFIDLINIYKKIIKKYIEDKKPFALQIYNTYNSEFSKYTYEDFDVNSHPCQYAMNRIVINNVGDIQFCPLMNLSFGNYRNFTSLKKALNNEEMINFKKIKINDLPCVKCKYLKLCGGGCRSNALVYLKDIKGVDPIACIYYPLVEKYILPMLTLHERKKMLQLIDEDKQEPNKVKKVELKKS